MGIQVGIDADIDSGIRIGDGLDDLDDLGGSVASVVPAVVTGVATGSDADSRPASDRTERGRKARPDAGPADTALVTVARQGRTILLAGRIDVSTVADVRLALHAAVDAGSADLLVDLSGVEFVDASGLGVLVGTHRRAGRAGRRLVLRNVPDRVLRLLALTRLNRVLFIEELSPAPLVAAG